MYLFVYSLKTLNQFCLECFNHKYDNSGSYTSYGTLHMPSNTKIWMWMHLFAFAAIYSLGAR